MSDCILGFENSQKWTADGKKWQKHRWLWTLHYGEIPDGYYIRRDCEGGRRCYNVEHMYMESRHDFIPPESCFQALKPWQRNKNHDGTNNPHHKLTEDDVLRIRAEYDHNTETLQEIADRYGVTSVTIRNIGTRKTWQHLGNVSQIPHREPQFKNRGVQPKLTADKVRSIRDLYAAGSNRIELSDKFGVTRQCITQIVNRQTWKDI